MKHLITYNEMIKVPIKVGDTVLGGRFKNKKIVVKKIGKNAKGDITINGKPLLKFRIIKESHESIQDMIDNIKDICLDITDDGRFRVSIGIKTGMKIPVYVEIFISLSDPRDYDGFVLGEVESVLKRIYDYLTIGRYLGCSVVKVGEQYRSAMKYVTHGDRLSNIVINFTENNPIKEHKLYLDSIRIPMENTINDCLQDLTDDGFNVDLSELSADYPEVSLTKYGESFSMDEVSSYLIDLNSHLQGNHSMSVSRILYKEEVSYGMEDSMKAPQEVDDGWRHTDIENINNVHSNKIHRIEILLIDK